MADAVRMKGRRKPAWISEGFSSRVRTRKTVPRWKTPQVEAPEALPARHAAPQRCRPRVGFSALRSLTV